MAFPGSADSNAKPALLPSTSAHTDTSLLRQEWQQTRLPSPTKLLLQNSRGKEILPRLPHREWAPGQTTRWDNPSDIFFSPSKKNPVPGHSGTRQVPTLPHNLLGFPVLKRNPHYIYPNMCVGIREPRELSLSFYHTDLRDGSGHQAW